MIKKALICYSWQDKQKATQLALTNGYPLLTLEAARKVKLDGGEMYYYRDAIEAWLFQLVDGKDGVEGTADDIECVVITDIFQSWELEAIANYAENVVDLITY